MHRSAHLSSTALGICLVALSPAAASAQDAPASVFEEEIIVTAQKREQDVQDVGISMTALTGETLDALGITNTSEIAALVPAVNIQSVGGTDAQLVVNIRGVSQNDFGDHNEPPIAVYVDEAYVSWLGAVGMMTYDLDRVEALRGPQGTLFGRNATGGLVHFITNAPTDEFTLEAFAEYSSHDSYTFEGVIGGAVAEGVSVRLAAAYDQAGDYISNTANADLGGSRQFALRAQVLARPSDYIDVLLKAEYSNLDGDGSAWTHSAAAPDPSNHGLGRLIGDTEVFWDPTLFAAPGCAGCDALGYRDGDGDIDTVDQNDPAYFRRDIYDLLARVTADFDGVTLTSISDYRYVDRQFGDDSDAGPITLNALTQNIDGAAQFSQEFRLNGESGALNWLVGAYYLNIEGDYLVRLDTTFSGDPALDFISNSYSLDTESYALFGESEYALTPTLSVIAGLRWTHEEKDFSYLNTDGFGGGVLGGGLDFSPATVGDLAHQDGSNISYRAGVNWRPDDDLLVYASVSRANKGGGFSASLDGLLPATEVPYVDEVLTSYEAGFKATLFDGRLRFNLGGFYYDYEDYQAFTFQGLTQAIINVDARVYGSEVELTATPADGLSIMIAGSWLNSEAYDVPMPDGSLLDRPLPQSPEFSLKGLVRQAWMTEFGEFALQANAIYQTDTNYNIVGHETTSVDDFTIVNLRASLTPPGERFTLSVFVDNLSDERYPVSAIDASGPITGGLALRAMNRPRWFGASVRARF